MENDILTDDQIIKDLGIENLNAELQEDLTTEYRLAIGTVIADDLSQEKLDEFDQIIQGNQAFIDQWLAENNPDFRSDSRYGILEESGAASADKAFAAAAWVEKNCPDFAEKVSEVKQRFKADVRKYTQ